MTVMTGVGTRLCLKTLMGRAASGLARIKERGREWVSGPFEDERRRVEPSQKRPAGLERKRAICFVEAPRRGVQTLLRRLASHLARFRSNATHQGFQTEPKAVIRGGAFLSVLINAGCA